MSERLESLFLLLLFGFAVVVAGSASVVLVVGAVSCIKNVDRCLTPAIVTVTVPVPQAPATPSKEDSR